MNNRRMAFAARLLVMAVTLYVLMLGGTFNGVINLTIARTTLILITGLVAGWAIVRWRYGWRWAPVPLRVVLIAGVVVVLTSSALNLDSIRRITIGLWYAGIALGCWLILHDLITNGMPSRWLIDGILLTGIPVLLFGYVQLYGWFQDWAAVVQSGLPAPFVPIRPSSIIGNPNALGSFLLVVTLLSVGRLFQQKRWSARLVWGGYLAVTAALLFLTFSRGAWLGTALGGGVIAVMPLRSGWFSVARMREFWQRLAVPVKALIVGMLVIAAAGALVVVSIAWRMSTQPGRSFFGSRDIIWEAAWRTFLSNPLAGTGPFTFGKDLLAFVSVPPNTPHSHAHNVVLHTAAELGLPGLIVLLAGMWFAGWRWWHRVTLVQGGSRIELIAVGAAFVGYAGHHLVDIPATMPAIALLAIVIAAVAVASDPLPSTKPVGVSGGRLRRASHSGRW
jgi:O-antigen ligase